MGENYTTAFKHVRVCLIMSRTYDCFLWLGSLQAWLAESRRLRTQLQTYGVAGLLAYGLLNTIYYSAAFLIIWLYIVKVPRGTPLSSRTSKSGHSQSLMHAI